MPSPIHLVPVPEATEPSLPLEYAKILCRNILKESESFETDSSAPPNVGRMCREHGYPFLQLLADEFAARPIDYRYISNEQVISSAPPTKPYEYRQYIWFKANGPISDDSGTHAMALAYASDHDLMNSSVRAHEDESATSGVNVMASLDHCIYFHEVYPSKDWLMKQIVKMDDWLLYETFSPCAGDSRGLNLGYVYSKDGKHVATCVQECMLRFNDATMKAKL